MNTILGTIQPYSMRTVWHIANQPGICVIADHAHKRAKSLHCRFRIVLLIEKTEVLLSIKRIKVIVP